KIISFYAKKARGLMAAWLTTNRITDPAKLSQFDLAGYKYSKQDSSDDQLIFLRDEIN
ncbi:MAG: peroxide stress protein YaaA, partial [Proteobacteria bacterium]|nr:peroxide stress protein YaaA [Pseudomonadota bacterium]